jgi:hypothetical protein
MRVVGVPNGPVFATEESLVAAPVRGIGVVTGGKNRTADLAEGRWVRVGDGLELHLDMDAPTGAGPMAILLDLVVAEAMTAEWSSHGAPPAALFPTETVTATPSRTAVELFYRNAGGLVRLPGVDGTRGLRRSGTLRFTPPADWQADSGRYVLHVRVPANDFAFSPRLAGVHANAVIARHWRRVVLALRRSWLPLPGVTIELPAALGAPLPRWLRAHLREKATPDRWQTWNAVADHSTSGPGERVLEVDRERGQIRFGDGQTGRQPVISDSEDPLSPPIDLGHADVREGGANLILEYLVGGGVGGDLGPDQAWTGVDSDHQASSPVAASGGAPAESLDEARTRAAAERRTPHRAVTRGDHQELARTTPGTAIARAHAAVGDHPGHPCRLVPGATTVYLVPVAPRDEDAPTGSDDAYVAAPVPDAETVRLVQERLELVRLAGHEVFVRGPRYREAGLRFQVEADPRSPAALEAKVRAALNRYLDPLVGGDEGRGWPFGEPLRPSALVKVAQAAVGREGEVASVAIAVDGAAAGDVSCTDVSLGPVGLPRLTAVHVDFLARRASREVLR